ncbi:MAG: hypothetical protein L0H36_01920 [bacterium]|nr:hypothetical protein [bacterium]MDN5835371.1 hypothetical protein [bacterium]
MELLKQGKRRSLISESMYIILNIVLAAAILAAVIISEVIWPALLLVFLSKWRVLAVRPRFWMANIQANLVDFMVSISTVVLLFTATSWIMQVIITVLYVGWLVILKPQSKKLAMVWQAGVALFASTTALFTVSYHWWASVVVLLMIVIGYGVTRHVLAAYGEKHHTLYSMIGGLFMAEFGWFFYHWTVAYPQFGMMGIKIPQVAIILTAVAFVLERIYNMYIHKHKFQLSDIALPLVLAISVAIFLLIFRNGPGVNSF